MKFSFSYEEHKQSGFFGIISCIRWWLSFPVIAILGVLNVISAWTVLTGSWRFLRYGAVDTFVRDPAVALVAPLFNLLVVVLDTIVEVFCEVKCAEERTDYRKELAERAREKGKKAKTFSLYTVKISTALLFGMMFFSGLFLLKSDWKKGVVFLCVVVVAFFSQRYWKHRKRTKKTST